MEDRSLGLQQQKRKTREEIEAEERAQKEIILEAENLLRQDRESFKLVNEANKIKAAEARAEKERQAKILNQQRISEAKQKIITKQKNDLIVKIATDVFSKHSFTSNYKFYILNYLKIYNDYAKYKDSFNVFDEIEKQREKELRGVEKALIDYLFCEIFEEIKIQWCWSLNRSEYDELSKNEIKINDAEIDEIIDNFIQIHNENYINEVEPKLREGLEFENYYIFKTALTIEEIYEIKEKFKERIEEQRFKTQKKYNELRKDNIEFFKKQKEQKEAEEKAKFKQSIQLNQQQELEELELDEIETELERKAKIEVKSVKKSLSDRIFDFFKKLF